MVFERVPVSALSLYKKMLITTPDRDIATFEFELTWTVQVITLLVCDGYVKVTVAKDVKRNRSASQQ